MTTITKAAQQAIDALEQALPELCIEHMSDAKGAIKALRAALQDKAGEVSRYQAIRDGLVYIEPHESGEIYVAGETGVYTNSGDEFDAAIDAIAASQQKGGQHG